MKHIKWIAPALVLMLVFAWGAVALAQSSDSNDPANAAYIDNQTHSIPGGGIQWYRFDYGGGNSLITVKLVEGAGTNLRFNVFTPEQMADWPNETPIGRGTVLSVNCNSGIPTPSGGCSGDDLVWEGKFRTGGTYYVQLFNDNPQQVSFTLTVAGDDVAQCVQAGQTNPANPNAPLCGTAAENMAAAQTAAPTAAITLVSTVVVSQTAIAPALTITPTATVAAPTAARTVTATVAVSATTTTVAPTVNPNDPHAPNTYFTDPFHALPLNGQPMTIPGNASIWYRFEYSGDGSNITLRLDNGASNGLSFALYLPEQAPTWYNETPIGRGTGTPCDAAAADPTTCGENANALLWSGKFQTGGTYFVRVDNPNPNPVQFVFTVSGPGVSVCSSDPALNPVRDPSDVNYFPCPVNEVPTPTTTPTTLAPTSTPLAPRPTATPTAAG